MVKIKVFINEKPLEVEKGIKAYQLRDEIDKKADLIIINGHMLEEDLEIKENDRLIFIIKDEIPKKDELESLLMARHTPGVHEKVRQASVGIAGLGGLGSNVAISLARLGIGKLILIDYDIVEPSNLNRQQYFIKHIGMYKAEALQEIIKEINPFIEVEIKKIYLNQSNIGDCFKDVDIIVEAFDKPKCKAELVNTVLRELPQKYIIASSGMAGYFSNNIIKTKKLRNNFYLVGDQISEAMLGCGLMAPRVQIVAGHQANTVLRIILGEMDI